LRIDVYEKGSPHFGDQARVILAQIIWCRWLPVTLVHVRIHSDIPNCLPIS
jgi:hypothetical protein